MPDPNEDAGRSGYLIPGDLGPRPAPRPFVTPTVAQLIERLQQFDPSLPVVVDDKELGWCEIHDIKIQEQNWDKAAPSRAVVL